MILQNANAALVETDWNGSVALFMGANTEFQNPIMTGAFQAALQELYAVQENIGSSHAWYLETARRAVLEQITPAQATADNPADNAGTPQQQAAAKIVGDGKARSQAAATARKGVPTTLADAPAGGENPAGEDEFSALDALNGIELEAALAKLTDAQQDKYLRAGM
jgi:alkyl hydroperoxide reductase subunit AhpF